MPPGHGASRAASAAAASAAAEEEDLVAASAAAAVEGQVVPSLSPQGEAAARVFVAAAIGVAGQVA